MLLCFYQNISSSLNLQEPAALMPNHLISAVLEWCHNKQFSPFEIDELTLDDGVYLV